MPNWCENLLHIESNKIAEVRQLHDYVKEHGKLFTLLDPLPEDYNNKELTEEQLTAMHGYKDWYDWQVAHWGTKWDIDLYTIDMDDTPDYISLNITFGTAWSPAGEEILTKLLEFLNNYSATVDNYFYEPGMSFIGDTRLYHVDIDNHIACFTSNYTLPYYDCYSNKDYNQLCLDEGIGMDLMDAFNLEENMYQQCINEVQED